MKTIEIRKSGTGIERVFLIIFLPIMVLGLVQLFMDYENSFMNSVHSIMIICPIVIISFRLFKPNTVFWNNMGFSANIGNKFGTVVKYVDIKEVVFEDSTMTIRRLTSKDLEFDLSNYEAEDVEKLQAFISDQTNLYGLRKYKTSIA